MKPVRIFRTGESFLIESVKLKTLCLKKKYFFLRGRRNSSLKIVFLEYFPPNSDRTRGFLTFESSQLLFQGFKPQL